MPRSLFAQVNCVHRVLHAETASRLTIGIATAVIPASFSLAGAAAAETTGQPSVSGDAIVVIGEREVRGAVPDIVAQRSIDAQGLAGYGASNIRDVVAEVAREEGDDEEPVIFVNGVPIEDFEDIADFPAEALERIDVLPRGAGVRAGGQANQRAYNIVLRESFGSVIGTAGYGFTTEGGWHSGSAEAVVSRISGQQRFNITLRASDEGMLREDERGVIQPAPVFPFATLANIVADPVGGTDEIDAALSAAAGRRVTIVGLPAGVTSPTFADMLAGASRMNLTNLAQFRSLRPASRAYEAGLNLNQPITSWLNLTANARFDQRDFVGLAGLAGGLFVLPPGHPQSPFATSVAVARYNQASQLTQDTRLTRANLSLGLNAQVGKWQLGLRGEYRHSGYDLHTDRPLRLPGERIVLGPGDNPFAPDIGILVPTALETARSRSDSLSLAFNASGRLVELPAGPLRLNFNSEVARRRQTGETDGPFFQSARELRRTELAAATSLEIPLSSREKEFLGAIGDLSATLSYGVTEVSALGSVERRGYGVLWQPVKALQFQFALDRDRRLPEVGQLGEATTISENVRFFDFVTGETVDVIQVSGGNPDLLNERGLRRRLSAELRPWQATDLRLFAEHLLIRESNPISALPPASLDLLLAFPERFVRDAGGRLVLVDVRPVNFVAQRSEQLRWGLSFALPAKPAPGAVPPGPTTRSRITPLRLQFDLAHTINLANEVEVRDGFPTIDLLDGGATGFGGSLPRHMVTGSVNLGNSLGGLRVSANWRGASTLRQGMGGQDEVLDLGAFTAVNLRGHLDLGAIWPEEKALKSTRLSLNITNLLNQRQKVTDGAGNTPLRFQPAYRDPLGRTVSIEFRRSF